VGFGYNAIRYPLQFSFTKTEEIALCPNERYQLVCEPDEFQLRMLIKDTWVLFYRIKTPIKSMDDEEFVQHNEYFLSAPGIIPIRDVFLKIGKVTETGRIGFHFEPKKSPFYAFKAKTDAYNGTTKKTFYEDFQSFQNAIKKSLGFEMPDITEFKTGEFPLMCNSQRDEKEVNSINGHNNLQPAKENIAQMSKSFNKYVAERYYSIIYSLLWELRKIDAGEDNYSNSKILHRIKVKLLNLQNDLQNLKTQMENSMKDIKEVRILE